MFRGYFALSTPPTADFKSADAPVQPDAHSPQRGGAWPPLSWQEALPALFALIATVAATFHCLPPGICFGDFGDLQLAGGTLGIAHPPGYPIYATLSWVATLIPGLDPMFATSLASYAAGLAALTLCSLIQIRAGVNPWVAATVSLGLILYHHVRLNLIAPEVYGWTLAFLAAAAYLLMKFARVGRDRELGLAGLCFGVAAFSRPPIGLAAPFFLVAWWLASTKLAQPTRLRWRSLALLTVCFLLPGIYSASYLLLRDRVDHPYNYIEHYNADDRDLPTLDQGLDARIRRMVWTMSGAQFTEYVKPEFDSFVKKARWLAMEVSPHGRIPLIFLAGAAFAGAGVLLRKNSAAGIALLGTAAQAAIYVSIYNVHGQAADVMPILFAGGVFTGVVLSKAVSRARSAAHYLAIGSFVAGGAITLTESFSSGLCRPANIDAAHIADQSRMDDLPPDSVVLAAWDESVPLRYALIYRSNRLDVTIITSPLIHWSHLADEYAHRPIFISRNFDRLAEKYDLTPVANLWQLTRRDSATRR